MTLTEQFQLHLLHAERLHNSEKFDVCPFCTHMSCTHSELYPFCDQLLWLE